MSLREVLGRLGELVACDTQNPPRRIDGDSAIFQACLRALGSGFHVETWDHGDGHVSWFAVRGTPKGLFNVHLDTVPSGEGWSSNPFELRIDQGRAYGRGTCDIKGAAAVLLALAQQGAEHLALLFTTDEEGAGGCCVQKFLEGGHADRFEQVIVAEPTGCRAVLAHRGFLSVKMRFTGQPGHSSEARALADNANHQMALWAAAAVAAEKKPGCSAGDPGNCFNIGLVGGGTKSNVIAGECRVHWSARLGPGKSTPGFLREMKACVAAGSNVEWEVPFAGEPLPASGHDSRQAEEFCLHHALERGAAVDFWTEAALFSAAGMPALVMGPGSITQAHVTDEWVALDQLERCLETYARLVRADG